VSVKLYIQVLKYNNELYVLMVGIRMGLGLGVITIVTRTLSNKVTSEFVSCWI